MTIIDSIRELWRKHPESKDDLEVILRNSLKMNVGLPPSMLEQTIEFAFRELDGDA